ncbi:hypothetical protein A6A22_10905 [Arthrobacter sp. OY3WO11]|nr:hypothetical protein A6A22_10905 [Arthrobacter sp. OY3WO11]
MKAFALYQPYPVRYFATTHDQARDIVWRELLNAVRETPNFLSKDEQRLEVTLRSHLGFDNIIKLAGWENIDTARGKNAGLLVLDEVDSMRNFDGAWNEVLRPLLSDTKGSGIFMGTPKGYKTLFRLSQRPATDEDYEFFHFSSYDNPFLDPSEIDKAKREVSPNQFAQEYLAQFKKMEGLVYEEFDRDAHIKPLPFEPVRRALCIDFGYNHPLAAYLLAISADDRIHVERELYQSRLDDVQRASKLRSLISGVQLDEAVGDSEDPIAIVQVGRELGINLEGAVKGKDSVLGGINQTKALFANGELTIDPSCTNLAWELENYTWRLDKEGKAMDEPLKENDDAVDSLRYGVMKIRHNVNVPRLTFL